MVLGVCRRVLGNAADAEDAFQATFLVLVRKAAVLKARAVVGDWLHGVARRTALRAKGVQLRNRAKEQAMARPEAQGHEARDDWLPLLDQELSGLPEKYRLPLVLCDLEGRTRKEAAARLGWPEGTVAGRLARGRALLSSRLVRRGAALPGGALTAALPAPAASASVPAALLYSTIKAATLVVAGQTAAGGAVSAKAALLMGEVMKAMLLTKLKTVALALAVCAFSGFGWWAYRSGAEEVARTAPSNNTGIAHTNQSRLEDHTKRQIREVETGNRQRASTEEGDAPHELATFNSLLGLMREPLDMALFNEQPMTLKEFLGLLYDVYQKKGKELSILIDVQAFRDESVDADPFECVIKFPSFPRVLETATALREAINQIPASQAEILARDGYFLITTKTRASLPYLLRQRLFANYQDRPSNFVVQNLSERTGASVALDPRIADKAKTRITVAFRSDVTLGGALRIVADMAGLKVVNMESGLYITTPANAKELEKELRELKNTAEAAP
jgi:RNA polymerase sigma factor (sigma-70 family)